MPLPLNAPPWLCLPLLVAGLLMSACHALAVPTGSATQNSGDAGATFDLRALMRQQNQGHVAKAGDYAWSARATITAPDELFLAARALLIAERPFDAETLLRETEPSLKQTPFHAVACALVDFHLGRVPAVAQSLRTLNAQDVADPWLIYLAVRHQLLVGSSKQQPRRTIDIMLTDATLFPEFYLAAADWAQHSGDDESSQRWLEAFVARNPRFLSRQLSLVRAHLEFNKRFPAPEVREFETRVELPLRLDPLPMARFSINGQEPVWLVVDTGATHLLLDAVYAREALSLPAGPKVDGVATATGITQISSSQVDELSAPGLRITRLKTGLFDWRSLVEKIATSAARTGKSEAIAQAALLRETHGLIGAGVLAKDRSLWFDTEGGRLVVAATHEALNLPHFVLEKRFFGELPVASAQFGTNPESLVLLDTGMNNVASINETWARASGLTAFIQAALSPAAPELGLAGFGKGTDILASPPTLSIWPPDALHITGETFSLGSEPFTYPEPVVFATVGWELLRQYSPVFGYRDKKVWLRALKSSASPTAYQPPAP